MSDNKLGQLPSASDNIAGLCEILRKANDPPPDAWLASWIAAWRRGFLDTDSIRKEQAEKEGAELLEEAPPATAQKSERRL